MHVFLGRKSPLRPQNNSKSTFSSYSFPHKDKYTSYVFFKYLGRGYPTSLGVPIRDMLKSSSAYFTHA